MNELALCVKIVERIRYAAQDDREYDFVHTKAPAAAVLPLLLLFYQILKRPPIHELENQVDTTLIIEEVVQLHNVLHLHAPVVASQFHQQLMSLLNTCYTDFFEREVSLRWHVEGYPHPAPLTPSKFRA